MSKFKVINLIDKLFITCVTFLIIYAWINFYLRDLWTTFILSLIFTFAVIFVFTYFLNKKQTRINLNKKQLEDINTQFYIFKLNSLKQRLNLLNEILSKENKTTIKNDTIFFEQNNKKIILIIATRFEIIDNIILTNLISEFNNDEADEIQIVCNEVQPNINLKLLKNKDITIVNKKSLYIDYFLKHNMYPDASNINLKNTKITISTIIRNMFNSSKGKGYFFCGLILIFSSIILPYHFYYLIVGSTLLLFSLICKLLPIIKE